MNLEERLFLSTFIPFFWRTYRTRDVGQSPKNPLNL